MPRELKVSDKNSITIFDSRTGEKVTLFYKTPTNTETIQYQSGIVNAVTKKQGVEGVSNVQLEWAKKFLTGFEEGYFLVDGKPLTTEDPAWKEVIAETASDLLFVLIKYLFGEASYVVKEESHPFLVN